ncbi:MAG: tetratricopeptide repeat protein [Bacteroidales bacterium]|nr:tetratricopeptide repeat protein [Bacteroidales bacterium]
MKANLFYSRIAGILFISGLLVSGGCSTKKNTFVRRTYHNLTSHYNVYWNGMDNLRTGLKDYELSIKDNYALVLPVFNYGDRTSAGKLSQYTDIAIKKASKAINKHSMTFNRKEYVRWIDDAYLLIGKSYFYKQDYPMARRTFEFVIKTYNDNEIKYEAMLWQAKSNVQLGDFTRAEPMLDMLLSKINKGEAPDSYETEVNLVYAQSYILQKNYNTAVPYLLRALELKQSGAVSTRCRFILGQIYQQNGDLAEASKMYTYVVKKAPSYEMEFNAKINLAQCYDAKSGNREFIIKKMTRMLKDDKNKDFQDQIYYALAHIAIKDSDTATAIGFYRKSVTASRTNNYQKAISSLELADIFFGRKNYQMAQAYYDSTLQFLPKDYPNYKDLSRRTATLTDLVSNLQIISTQDSLRKLANMTESERNKIIDQIIAQLVAEEMKKKMEEMERQENKNVFGQMNQQESLSSGSKEGRWYFYNPTTLSSGFSTFVRKWGRRKFEDNWFLTDKTLVAFSNEPAGAPDTLSLIPGDTSKISAKLLAKSTDPKDRAFYLKDLPLTKDKIKASDDQIVDAFYKAGFIYVEGLGDYGNSTETFEQLLERYPDNKYKVQTLYELCILYQHLQNQPKSDQYKNQIISNYPESDYAKLLINPNFYKEIHARKSEASVLYNDTYKAFQNQQYYMVINNTDIAHTKFPTDTAFMPKFDYLRALALGKIEVVDSMVVAINKVIKDYPRSKVKPLAENVLAFLGAQPGSTVTGASPDSSAKIDLSSKLYKFDPNALHFFVIIVDGDLVDVDALKIKISDYNTKFHDLDQLMINSILLDERRQMITINNFDNSDKAMNYLIGIRDSKYIFTRLENAGTYYDFVISVENYPVLYKNKDIPQYLRFFEKNYPIKK